MQMGKYMGEKAGVAIDGEIGLGSSRDNQLVAQPGGGVVGSMEVEDDYGGATTTAMTSALTPAIAKKSELKTTLTMISINQAALNRIRKVDEITLQYNIRPRNTGNSEKFIQLIFNHSNNDE